LQAPSLTLTQVKAEAYPTQQPSSVSSHGSETQPNTAIAQETVSRTTSSPFLDISTPPKQQSSILSLAANLLSSLTGYHTSSSSTPTPPLPLPNPPVFPRWKDTNGINLMHIISFMRASVHARVRLLDNRADDYDKFAVTPYIVSRDNIRTSNKIRSRHMHIFIISRAEQSETMFAYALKSWRRLTRKRRNALYPLLTRTFNEGMSFPILANYEDYLGCNKDNYPLPDATKVSPTNVQPPAISTSQSDISDNTTKGSGSFDMSNASDSITSMIIIPTSNNTAPSIASLPVFTTCARVDCDFAWPLPTYRTVLDSRKSNEWDKVFAEQAAKYPWKNKKRQVVWRGSLSGSMNVPLENPRWYLAKHVHEVNSSYWNIGLFRIPPRHFRRMPLTAGSNTHRQQNRVCDPIGGSGHLFPEGCQLHRTVNLAEVGGIKARLPREEFATYRAVLDIDGNSWSSRFGSLMCDNSVVIKVEPKFVDFFHFHSLQSWKHYVPVKYDLSDLEEQTEFVMDPRNDNVVLQIVQNAQQWCMEHMNPDALAHDTLYIWEKYLGYLDAWNEQWREIWAQEGPRLLNKKTLRRFN
jgi:Glycosyl transferase family 90